MANEHTGFWLALLDFGNGEEERRKNWNAYCYWRFGEFLRQLIAPAELKNIREKIDLPSGFTGDFERCWEQFAADLGGHPQTPKLNSFMDFSGTELTDNVSLAGRLLIGANFRETVFKGQTADFRGAEFFGLTEFDGADFFQLKSNSHNDFGASFSRSTFHDLATFDRVKFPYLTMFDGVEFRDSASFSQAEFWSRTAELNVSHGGEVQFDLTQFHGTVAFWKAKFGTASFIGAEMKKAADFHDAVFCSSINFNNARFQGTSMFRKATFWRPPKFFEAELHEDVTFSEANWKVAEESYRRSFRRNGSKVRTDAEGAMRAWDRLALIMSQREKLPERHEFFRLKMRAQRQRDGLGLLSFLNLLFDKTSDYGWSVGRALSCWSAQFVVMGAVHFGLALNCSSGSDAGWLQVLKHGILLSFANSHAFLRLAAGDGWLHGSRDAIVNSCPTDWPFVYIGLAQAVLGPILLFLVLLTLRNRFRLG
ncbi:MAG: pentapeptide repeat-containing protein [Albidovulum sp.]|nr:pentapeptide repeat-containing protein [Albidovulum sp.]